MHIHNYRAGLLTAASFLLLSCDQQEPQKSPTSNEEENQSSTTRRGSEAESGAVVSARSGKELSARMKVRTLELQKMEGEALMQAIRQGLEEDEFLELSTLGQWEGDMDVQSIEAILLDHFRTIGWDQALENFDLLEGNLALSAPILSHILKGVSAEDPEKAKQWLVDHSDSPGAASAAAVVGSELANQENPSQSFEQIWNGQMPDEILTNMVDGFVSNWVTLDFDGAFQHLSTMEADPLLDQTFYNLMSTAGAVSAADTMPWAESITNEGLRRSAIVETARKWSSSDEASYQKWKASEAPADLLSELP